MSNISQNQYKETYNLKKGTISILYAEMNFYNFFKHLQMKTDISHSPNKTNKKKSVISFMLYFVHTFRLV
jgi:hypothetical protein